MIFNLGGLGSRSAQASALGELSRFRHEFYASSRGHGAMYDALNQGRVEPERLRRSLASLPLPRATGGQIVLGVDVSPWLRPDAATSPERLFCHVYGRGRGQAQLIPGWPYSFVAALETGRNAEGRSVRPDAVRIFAGVVLLYLAVSTWRRRVSTRPQLSRRSLHRICGSAVLTYLANPEVALFYLAFLP